MKIRVADYIAKRCIEAGAKHVFLVTGGGAMHLNDAFSRNKNLTPICFHHEQAASIAAESYFRLTNRLAVLNVTTGPGGINALNGVFGAYVDSLSMLVISGQVKRETFLKNYKIPLRQLGDQEVDIISMAKPIVKYATILQKAEKVREVMDKAIFLATNGRPGPVWIDVPIDIQGSLIDEKKIKYFSGNINNLIKDFDVTDNTRLELINQKRSNNNIIKTSIFKIIKKLKKSKRPLILAGTGIRISGAHKEFLNLVNILKIPVVTGFNAHDILTNDSPYFVGRPGTVGDRPGNFAVQNSDFLLILGCRLNIRQISYNWKNFAKKAWKAMVDVDETELNKPTLDINLKINCSLKLFIEKFTKFLKKYKLKSEHNDYLLWCKERVQRYPVILEKYRSKKRPINPYFFIERVFKKLKDNDVIVTGNGSACIITFQVAQLKNGQRLFSNSGNAQMGYDLPAAIGASIANKNKRVICITGDGSIMMNIQELQTIVGYNLPIKIIILNNNGYHSIRQTQKAYFPDNMFGIGPDNGVSLPNFTKLGNAIGIKSITIKNISEWSSIKTERNFNNSKCCIFDVHVDTKQFFAPKLASRKLKDGSMISSSLEDMFPFLSRKELKDNII